MQSKELATSSPSSGNSSAHDDRAFSTSVTDKDRQLVLIVYILFAVGFFLPLLPFIGAIISHIKRSGTKGTWLESHHRWLIRTFWYGLLWTVLGLLTYGIFIGWGILIATLIWTIYRVVWGFMAYHDQKPLYRAS